MYEKHWVAKKKKRCYDSHSKGVDNHRKREFDQKGQPRIRVNLSKTIHFKMFLTSNKCFKTFFDFLSIFRIYLQVFIRPKSRFITLFHPCFTHKVTVSKVLVISILPGRKWQVARAESSPHVFEKSHFVRTLKVSKTNYPQYHHQKTFDL
jgi:hypothetical protein